MADQPNLNTPDAGDLNAAAREECVRRGWAMEGGRYPIRDAAHHGRADLEKAVKAVGRGSGSHDAIRRHIMKRARALSLSSLVPDEWSSSGTSDSAGRTASDAVGGDVLYRSYTPDLELRSKGDGRTIVGIAVPYGRPQWINPALTEQFRQGAFNDHLGPVIGRERILRSANKVPFARNHMALGGTLIGRAALLRDDAAGLYGEWRVSKTPAGEETLELVRDGALTNLSVAFRERTNAPLPGGVVERVTAELREVCVCLEGAYGEDALVAAVRAAGAPYAEEPQLPRVRADEAADVFAELPDAPGVRT